MDSKWIYNRILPRKQYNNSVKHKVVNIKSYIWNSESVNNICNIMRNSTKWMDVCMMEYNARWNNSNIYRWKERK